MPPDDQRQPATEPADLDDTNPSRAFVPLPTDTPHTTKDDTQPSRPMSRVVVPAAADGSDGRPVPWLLLAVLLLVGASLIVTLALVFSQATRPAPQEPPLTVTLQVDGVTRRASTSVTTVADLLAEQGVSLAPADAVLPPLDTPLTDGARIIVQRARSITLTVDDVTQQLQTPYDSPFDILSEQGIELAPYDRLLLDGQPVSPADLIAWPLPVSEVVVQRALPVQIRDGDALVSLNTLGDTVGDALYEAGITLFLADTVSPPLSEPVVRDMTIVIDRSRPVVIQVDDVEIETRINAQTVGGALSEAGVTLSGLDYTVPHEETPITPDLTIQVVRVTEDVVTTEETIPYETVYQADAAMQLDTRQVIQAGQNGLYRRTVRIRYENGERVAETVESEGVVQNPVDAVVRYGTNIVIRTVETPDGPLQYWRRLRMYATSYHPAALGGDNITSIGETLRKGIIAIDPDIVTYRTNMYVPGYGQGIAADTGGPRSTPYWVDLGYSDEDWIGWSRWVDVYLLLPIPAEVDYLLPENARGGPLP